MNKNLVEIHWKKIEERTIIHYPEIEDLCYRPYPNHPNGCPNIDKCEHENAISFDLFLECNPNFHYYLVYAKFDFKQYKQQQKIAYPSWSDKQIECVLYWQGSIKKLLREYIENLAKENRFYVYACGSGLKLSFQEGVGSMESAYINVFSTMRLNGVKMEVKPKNVIYLVCLLCSKEPLHFNKKLNTLDKWCE